jgi:DNA-binding FadR family transcriptional regulator
MEEPRSARADEELFGPLEAQRCSEKVAEAIRSTIVQGRIRPGECLPPERTLADRFRVTRNTVREALRILEQTRLVSIRQGSGIRVRDYLGAAGLEFAAAALTSAGADLRDWMRDIADARAVIGRAMTTYAVARLDPGGIQTIAAAVDAFCEEAGRKSPSVRRLQELDFEIQSRLVRASGNRALMLLHNSIRHVYERVEDLFAPLVRSPQRTADLYRGLIGALGSGERETAVRILDRYFETGKDALLADVPARKEAP